MNLKKKYKINIPDDQYDQSLEDAKLKKRMFVFPNEPGNYIRYDDKGKSYICSFHFGTSKWGKTNKKDNVTPKNSSESYDGTYLYLNHINAIRIIYTFNHVTPGNYKLFLKQSFDNNNMMLNTMTFRISISDKVIFTSNNFPNNNMVKVRGLSEFYIRDIKKEDFYMTKLDQNGDAIVKIEFIGNNDRRLKKGWLIDGARLLFD